MQYCFVQDAFNVRSTLNPTPSPSPPVSDTNDNVIIIQQQYSNYIDEWTITQALQDCFNTETWTPNQLLTLCLIILLLNTFVTLCLFLEKR
jgi:hypothetical protein